MYFSPAIGEPILLKPTVVEDRYECYPYDTMDDRRDIRCQVRSILEGKIRLALESPGDGSGGDSGGPGGQNGEDPSEGPSEGFGQGPL